LEDISHAKKNYHSVYDKFINVRDISFDSLETVKIGSDSHYLRPIAQQSICNRLGTPITYLRKCPYDVQAYNLNHWIEKEKNNELFFRFSGDDVRGLFSPRYIPLDNVKILHKLESLGFDPNNTKVQYALDENFMQINIPDNKKTFYLGKDQFQSGVSISNSEVGMASLSLTCYMLRLICSNGLLSRTQIEARFRHVSLKILQIFPEVFNELSYSLDHQKNQFQISLESRVSDPLSTLDSFNKQFVLSKEEREAVVQYAWPTEMDTSGNNTMFNIINAYTKSAQYENLSAHSSFRLQRVGGDILNLVK